ncbi:hypothetical protein EON79_01120 [bacterium]|nr:MAG: hypothetical protein EON79_01120 [bacterium]
MSKSHLSPMMRKGLALSLLGGMIGVGTAEMIPPQSIPTARILKTASENVRKHPSDPDAFYALGRIQYVIYCSNDPRAIAMYSGKPPFQFPSRSPNSWEFQGMRLKSDPATKKLVHSAIANLKSAIRLDKGREPGLYALTLACVYEAAAPIASKLNPKTTKQAFLDAAYWYYAQSFNEARKGDLGQPYAQISGSYEPWISVEAGEAMLRLVPKRNEKIVRKHLAEIKGKPGGPITPILFSLSSAKPLEELLDASKRVKFDLDGTGSPQEYGWTRPDTAILVWQPDPRVPITSGRQLFGSATWWMMYRDGYAALAALDTDGNGWLEGKELQGLAVWRDADQDGVSDPGEVTPLAGAGVRGLVTRSKAKSGRSPYHPQGVRLDDGRVLPTYDWVTKSGS